MIVPIRPLSARPCISLLCLSIFLLASGCGKPTGKVSGKVILDDQLLKGGGTVTFEGDKGGVSGIITPEGTYTIPNAPVGTVAIALGSGMRTGPRSRVVPNGRPPKKAPKESASSVQPLKNIPNKYTDPKSSGLTYTVQPGEQTFDIILSSR
ncbi:MAG TPA: hypothetical protein VMG10_05365 [Gemmataceae bacterium]|nr:hypothetical protein [Gemmataceae bacterium]